MIEPQYEKDGVTLYLGDCLQVVPCLEDSSVGSMVTDPPYFLSNDGYTCVAGKRRKVNKGEWDRSAGLAEDHAFNRAWLEACWRVLKPTGTLWVSGTTHVYLSVGMAMLELGFRIAVGDNACSGLGVHCAVLDQGGAQDDAGIHFSIGGEVADAARIEPALFFFQFVDDLHRTHLWRA